MYLVISKLFLIPKQVVESLKLELDYIIIEVRNKIVNIVGFLVAIVSVG